MYTQMHIRSKTTAIEKVEIEVKGVKDGKETPVYNCIWDGDLGDWMEIGGEVVLALDYDEAVVTFKKIDKKATRSKL